MYRQMTIADYLEDLPEEVVNALSEDDELICDEFIAYAKAEYGLTVEAVKSDTPDSFETLFGISTI